MRSVVVTTRLDWLSTIRSSEGVLATGVVVGQFWRLLFVVFAYFAIAARIFASIASSSRISPFQFLKQKWDQTDATALPGTSAGWTSTCTVVRGLNLGLILGVCSDDIEDHI
jgi:hypothetical protein